MQELLFSLTGDVIVGGGRFPSTVFDASSDFIFFAAAVKIGFMMSWFHPLLMCLLKRSWVICAKSSYLLFCS